MVDIVISKRMFNPVYLHFLDCRKRFMVLYGGAGSGKSYFVAEYLIYKILTLPVMNVLVVRKVSDTNRHSTFAMLCQIIHAWKLSDLFSVRESDMTISCINGNQIIFKGLDDREKLKSITFKKGVTTDIWMEEASEFEEEDFLQLNLRLRGGKEEKHFLITFNPVSVTHWLKRRFFDTENKNCEVLHTTYKDNLFIEDEYKEQLESYRDTDEYYYAVYCLGEWGVLGKTVFPARNVHAQLSKNIQPCTIGYFRYSIVSDTISDVEFVPDENGCIKIYKQPKEAYPYVLGGDTAGEGSDFFVGQLIDNTDGTQAAVLRMQTDEDLYAEQMYCLGMYYNSALIGIERNFSTHPIRVLEHFHYPNLYVQVDEDRFTHKPKQIFGFSTNRITRPLMIAELVRVMRDRKETVVDRDTLEEMLTFVRNEKGRPEAQEGKHDDCIMALGIAHHLRDFMPRIPPHEQKPAVVWEDDIWIDYYNADEQMRRKMIETFGNPFGEK